MDTGFVIELLPEEEEGPSETPPGAASFGTIRLGDHEERFVASLSFWSRENYRRHWIEALRRIAGTANHSCLITSITDPYNSNFISWWPMYRVGGKVYVQNQVLFLKQLETPFEPTDPYGNIGPRTEHNEDGDRISEWSVAVEAIEQFLALETSWTGDR